MVSDIKKLPSIPCTPHHRLSEFISPLCLHPLYSPPPSISVYLSPFSPSPALHTTVCHNFQFISPLSLYPLHSPPPSISVYLSPFSPSPVLPTTVYLSLSLPFLSIPCTPHHRLSQFISPLSLHALHSPPPSISVYLSPFSPSPVLPTTVYLSVSLPSLSMPCTPHHRLSQFISPLSLHTLHSPPLSISVYLSPFSPSPVLPTTVYLSLSLPFLSIPCTPHQRLSQFISPLSLHALSPPPSISVYLSPFSPFHTLFTTVYLSLSLPFLSIPCTPHHRLFSIYLSPCPLSPPSPPPPPSKLFPFYITSH
jgi:hypothetical protein